MLRSKFFPDDFEVSATKTYSQIINYVDVFDVIPYQDYQQVTVCKLKTAKKGQEQCAKVFNRGAALYYTAPSYEELPDELKGIQADFKVCRNWTHSIYHFYREIVENGALLNHDETTFGTCVFPQNLEEGTCDYLESGKTNEEKMAMAAGAAMLIIVIVVCVAGALLLIGILRYIWIRGCCKLRKFPKKTSVFPCFTEKCCKCFGLARCFFCKKEHCGVSWCGEPVKSEYTSTYENTKTALKLIDAPKPIGQAGRV